MATAGFLGYLKNKHCLETARQARNPDRGAAASFRGGRQTERRPKVTHNTLFNITFIMGYLPGAAEAGSEGSGCSNSQGRLFLAEMRWFCGCSEPSSRDLSHCETGSCGRSVRAVHCHKVRSPQPVRCHSATWLGFCLTVTSAARPSPTSRLDS